MEKKQQEELYDVVIIGGGPAGLSAAIYLARAGCRVLVLEKERLGGQIALSAEVANYPGVLSTDGQTLSETMRRQARSFGAEFLMAEAKELKLEGEVKTVLTDQGPFRCFGVLAAMGARPRSAGFQGEETFRGRGVSTCAVCDGELYTGRQVYVIGGGYAAAEESVFLARFASHVTILMRGEDFSCARSLADRARSHEKISVVTGVQVEAVSGSDRGLNTIRCRNRKTGEVTEYRAAEGEEMGLFVFAGAEPESALLRGYAELDEKGFVLTDRDGKTRTEGLYAAGDVCAKALRQVVTAVSDGAVAATQLEKTAAAMREKTGLKPKGPGKPESPFSGEISLRLQQLFRHMESPLILRLYPDERPASQELARCMQGLAALTDKLTVETARDPAEESERPCVRIFRPDGSDTGLAFHGVPAGHEFSSFVLGLFNAAGPGQELDPETERQIKAISRPVNMQILVTLSCGMCPDMVTAAQQIAAVNEKVRAEVYDISLFPALKEKYRVMSVPCLIIGGEQAAIGKKSLRQLLELISHYSEQ